MNSTTHLISFNRLHSDDPETRRLALNDLHDLHELHDPDPDLLPVEDLIALLDDENRGSRLLAIRLLTKLNHPGGIPLLLDTAADADAEIAAAARVALRAFRSRDAVGPLAAGAAHPKAAVRAAAIAALRDHRSARVLPILRKALQDEAAEVRGEAVAAIARVRGLSFLDTLRWSFYDQDAGVRRAAVGAVVVARAGEALRYLIRALGDRDEQVRLEAAVALGHFPENESILGLRRALRDESLKVIREAMRSLGRLRAQAGDDLKRFLDHAEPELRAAAAKALGEIGDATVRFRLSSLLGDREFGVARAAHEAISRLDAQEQRAA